MAGSHSKAINETDRRLAVHIRDEINKHTDRIKYHTERITFLLRLTQILQICGRCQGEGTINDVRTDDDEPFYEPCPTCEGRGHTREAKRG